MKFIPYQTRLAKQLADYLDIRNEVDEIRIFSTYYTEKYALKELMNNSDSIKVFSDDDFIPRQSIFVNIVMKYAKCFDSRSDRRSIKLDDNFLKGFDKKELEAHKELIELRNQFIAHAGNSIFQKPISLEIGFNEKGEIGYRSSESYKRSFGENVEIQNISFLIARINEKIEKKINELRSKIDVEMNSISESFLLQKLTNNEPFTDDDIC